MRIFSKIRKFLGSSARNESGLLTVDAILIFPMLVWTITGTFTFFEGFRQSAANLKAAYTIGDLISRETSTVTDTYIDSMHLLMARMVNNGTQLNMRVSLVVFDEGDNPNSTADDRHIVRWSTARGYEEIWTNDTIENMRESLPPMPHADSLIIVHTSNQFEPTFNAVLGAVWVDDDHTFTNFIFTRPRFTTEVACDFDAPLSFCYMS